MVTKAKAIADNNSLAAIDEGQEITKAFQQRATACMASAAAANRRRLDPDASETQPQTAIPAADASTTDLNAEDASEDSALDPTKSAGDVAKQFMNTFKDMQNAFNEEKELLESAKGVADQVGDSMEAASTAATGDVPAYSDSIKDVKEYVDKQADLLQDLSHKTPQDWLVYAGATDPSSFGPAQERLGQISQQLARVQLVTERFLPLVQDSEAALEHPDIQGVRAATADTTLTGLDPIALDWIASQLSSSDRLLDVIQNNINAARTARQ